MAFTSRKRERTAQLGSAWPRSRDYSFLTPLAASGEDFLMARFLGGGADAAPICSSADCCLMRFFHVSGWGVSAWPTSQEASYSRRTLSGDLPGSSSWRRSTSALLSVTTFLPMR